MSLLAGLIGLIGCLCLLVAILGGIAPSIFKDKKTGVVPKRSQLLAGGTIAGACALGVAAALLPPSEATAQPVSSQAPAIVTAPTITATAAQPSKSLGMTPETFRKSFNEIVGKIDGSYKIAEFDIEKGPVNDTVGRAMGGNVGLIGTLSKQDGKLKEFMVVVGGSEKSEDVLRPVIVMLSASQALNPKVPAEQNSKAVTEMAQKAMANIQTGEAVERQIGQLQYVMAASKATGLMFSISPL